MIRISMTILFALLLIITAGNAISAEMAKEGSGDYRSGKTGTFEALAMEKERVQMNYEETGVVVYAPENSPLYNASFRVLGTLHAIKGKWKGSGFVEFTRPNGDKVYTTYEGEGVLGGGPSKSFHTFVGGTGTCAGIEGTLELGNTPGIKPAKKGVYNGSSVGKFSWKIP
ncbi:MAG: hypothetical protein QNJ58_22610 [Desulfobacterales bacterium]|nr:hypothetical protein [Desulfobacterales bacterium]